MSHPQTDRAKEQEIRQWPGPWVGEGMMAESGADEIDQRWPRAGLAPDWDSSSSPDREMPAGPENTPAPGIWGRAWFLVVLASQQTQREGLGKAGTGQGRGLPLDQGRRTEVRTQDGTQAYIPRTFSRLSSDPHRLSGGSLQQICP